MKNSEAAHICAKIREVVMEKGWNGAQLSRESGISYRTINGIMMGVANLRPQNVQRIARALSVTPAALGAKDVPEGPPIIKESGPRYTTAADDAPAPVPDGDLYRIIGMLADATGIDENEVLKFVIGKMKGTKP